MKRKLLLMISIVLVSIAGIAQTNTTCNPDAANYNTGSTDGSTFTQTSLIRTESDNAERGWARFNTSAIPDGDDINSVELHIYVSDDNYAYFDVMSIESDPLLGTAASVFTDCGDGTQYAHYNSNFPDPGWYVVDLGAQAASDLKALLGDDWFGVGLYEYETYSGYYLEYDGWNETNPPYIIVSHNPPPSCPAPSNQNETNVTSSGADLGWTENGTATNWEIMIDTAGFDTTGYTHTPTTTNPYSAASLSANTSYDWYVRAVCGGGDTSNWVGPKNFNTECGIYTPEYLQGFSTFLPDCWSKATGFLMTPSTLTGTTSSWVQDDFANVSSNGKSARINIWGTSKKDWLISPSIDLSGDSYQLEFDLALTHYNNTNSDTLGTDDTLAVVISTDNGVTWNLTDTLQVWTYPEYISNTGERIIIDLSAYSTTVKIGFYGSSSVSNADNDVFIDNFRVRVPPTCPEPISIIVPSYSTTTADIQWSQVSGSSGYNWEIVATGDTPGTGVSVSNGSTSAGNDTTATATGLSPNTTYDAYVQNSCGSSWTGPATFTTDCSVKTAPWSDDFEAHTGTTNATWGDCWSANPAGTSSEFRWDMVDNGGSTPSSSTGPSAPHSGSNYAYTEASSGTEGDTAELYSPNIDISGLNTPLLVFYYHMYGATMGNLYIDIYDGTSWNIDVDSIIGQQQTNQTDSWLKKSVDISAFTGTIQVKFRGERGSSYTGDICIDDFSVEEAPTCFEPTDQYESQITSSAATLNWTTGGASEWQIEWDTANFVQGTGHLITTTNNHYNLTALTSNTEYDWYVRDICGVGDTSAWTGPSSFNTEITPNSVAAFPYSQSFEDSLGFWKQMVNDDFDWTRITGSTPTGSTGPSAAYAGSYYIYTESSTPNYPDKTAGLLLSFDFTSLTIPQLTFAYHMYGASMGTLQIEASTDQGTTWDTIWSKSGDQGNQWKTVTKVLSSYSGESNVYLKIWGVTGSNYYSDMAIDTIAITEAPSCPDPSDQAESNITTTSADLEWTENGSATTWEIMLDTTGFDTTGYAHTTITANPYAQTGLTSSYTYDWYIRSVCGAGDTSNWVGASTFTTTPPNDDCSNAVSLSVAYDTTYTEGTNVGATESNNNPDPIPAPGCANYQGGDVWYKAVVPASGYLTVTSRKVTGSNLTDSGLGIYKGTCGSLELLECDDDDSPDGAMSEITLDADSLANETVYIRFWEYGNNSFGKFEIAAFTHPTDAVWNGNTDNNWFDKNNWDVNGVPGANTNVTIPTGLVNYPTLESAATCNNFILESDASGDASLIGVSHLTVKGVDTIERYIASDSVWHEVSAMTTAATIESYYFNNNPDVWMQEYDESSDSRTPVWDLATVMPLGKGFEIWIDTGYTITATFTGSINGNNVALTNASIPPLSFTGSSFGYNLLGNPFTSAISWDSVFAKGAPANIDNEVWVWDPASGNYRTYTGAGGILTDGIIPMGQGFFIHANAASPALTIPTSAQVHSSQAFYAPSRDAKNNLMITVNKGNRNDAVLIAFDPEYSDEFESGLDGLKMMGSKKAPQLYIVEDGEKLSIDALPPVEAGSNKVLKLFFKAGVTGEQVMVAENLDNLPGVEVFLEDLKLDVIQSLNENPVYTFYATYYQNPDRFRLHFERGVNGIDNSVDNVGIKAYSNNKRLYVVSGGDIANKTKLLSVYDLTGRKILEKQLPPGELASVPVNLSNAYVVVRIISNGEVYTTKVFIK